MLLWYHFLPFLMLRLFHCIAHPAWYICVCSSMAKKGYTGWTKNQIWLIFCIYPACSICSQANIYIPTKLKYWCAILLKYKYPVLIKQVQVNIHEATFGFNQVLLKTFLHKIEFYQLVNTGFKDCVIPCVTPIASALNLPDCILLIRVTRWERMSNLENTGFAMRDLNFLFWLFFNALASTMISDKLVIGEVVQNFNRLSCRYVFRITSALRLTQTCWSKSCSMTIYIHL